MPLPNLGMNQMIIQKIVHDYVRNCVMCNTIDKGLGLYTPIHVPSCPCKDIVRDFDGRLPMSRKWQFYMSVVVDKFNRMCLVILCQKQCTVG